jgi:glycosyltransferase involved in cell wall biosynthesis
MIEFIDGATPGPQRPADIPRVLFVTPAAFNHITGGGITFSNLFRGWPRDRIATVHNDSVPVTRDVCDTYYELGPNEIAPRFRPAGTDRSSMLAWSPWSRPRAANRPGRMARGIKTAIIGNAWPDKGYLSADLESWIAAWRPDVMYTILGTIGIMELIDSIQRRFDLPTIVHFMDDWPSHLYRGGLLSPALRVRMDGLIRRIVGRSVERMAIGTAMAEAYSKRYGVAFHDYQNTVDLAAVESYVGKAPQKSRDVRPIRILYVGSIFDNAQAQSLIDIAQAVSGLQAGGRAIRFDLHSPAHLAEPFRTKLEISFAVRLHDAIEDDGVFFRTISEADILVLPVNFDRDSMRLIRYSMPTKLPAYLASGTPILVYGPRGVAQVDDAIRYDWGMVVEKKNQAALAKALLQLVEDPGIARRFVVNARMLAERRHSADLVRRNFQDALTAALRGEGSPSNMLMVKQ